jgi:hypothetical protein
MTNPPVFLVWVHDVSQIFSDTVYHNIVLGSSSIQFYQEYYLTQRKSSKFNSHILYRLLLANNLVFTGRVEQFLPLLKGGQEGSTEFVTIMESVNIIAVLRMIPKEVMAECRERATAVMAQGKPVNKTAAAIIVGVWICLAALCVYLIFL